MVIQQLVWLHPFKIESEDQFHVIEIVLLFHQIRIRMMEPQSMNSNSTSTHSISLKA